MTGCDSPTGRRILVDGSMARSGGGFTYLVNIIPQLAAAHPEDRFRLLIRSPRIAGSLPAAPNLAVDLLPDIGWAGRLSFIALEAPRLARKWGADVYFSAGEFVPLRAHCPVIASFRNPNVFTPMDQGWPLKQRVRLGVLRTLARISAATCARILFVSEDSARWIGDVMGLPPERRAVVHHGIDAAAWAPARRRDSGDATVPFILSVSSVYRYKNYVRLIEAYQELAHRSPNVPDLVIIGDDQDPAYSRQMQEARLATGDLADQIHILGEVPYAEIKRYYARAALFVFPSYLETFGHPLLEAMASDVPAVAADIPVFREIGGDAAFYADPHEAKALADAMHDALFLSDAREALVKRGRARVQEFGWSRTAARLSDLFDTVIAEAH